MGSAGAGDNLGKMAKNCMKMTKSALLGQNTGGTWGGGGKPTLRVVGGIPPVAPSPPPLGETLSYPRHTECSNLTEARWCNIYVIMRTMCPPGYHHKGFPYIMCPST